MFSLTKYEPKIPSLRGLEISKQYFKEGSPDDLVELRVVIPSEQINVRELSSFLHLIYRVDGTLSTRGIRAYSHNRNEQISFTQLKFGSSEFNIQEILTSIHAERLFVIWMFLRHIPIVLNSFFTAAEKAIDVQLRYEELVEKREKRRVRRALRELVTDDLADVQVDKKTKEKLVIILGELYGQNIKDLPTASRFIRHYVRILELRLKKKE